MALRKKLKSQFYGRICIDGSIKDFLCSQGKPLTMIKELITIQYKAWKLDSYAVFEQRLDGKWNVLISKEEE